jgi:glutamine synthetase
MVQLEVADYALGLRGKVLRPEKVADGKRPAFCTIVYGLDAVDDVADTPLSSAATRAADSAARARQYLKDLCAERGLLASFMAKPRVDASGAGGHIHQSLARDGANVTCEGPGVLSAIGRAYLAGLLDLMPALTLLMCPNPNSYRRLSSEYFVAERACWGFDDRNGACRVIAATTADGRIEHRRPGADVSPYLSAAAMLAAGWHGLTTEPDLIAPLALGAGGAAAAAAAGPLGAAAAGRALPATMAEAITAFEESAAARALLGEPFVESYLASRRFELRQFTAWLQAQVTSWEIGRYLEAL